MTESLEERRTLEACLDVLYKDVSNAADILTVKHALKGPSMLFLSADVEQFSRMLPSSKYFATLRADKWMIYHDIFLAHCFSKFLLFLLKNVAVNWSECFSQEDRRLLFEAYFVPTRLHCMQKGNGTAVYVPPADIMQSLRLLSNAISWQEHLRVARLTAELLEKLLCSYNVIDFYYCIRRSSTGQRLTAGGNDVPPQWHDFTSILCFLPDKMTNLFTERTPSFFVHK